MKLDTILTLKILCEVKIFQSLGIFECKIVLLRVRLMFEANLRFLSPKRFQMLSLVEGALESRWKFFTRFSEFSLYFVNP